MLHMLNYMSIKHKRIFECFNFFGKVFWFEKCQKFQKTVQPYFGDLPYGSSQLRAYIEGFCDSLAGQSPSHKKDLDFFKNLGF